MINLRRLTPYFPANAPDHGGECSMPLMRKGKKANEVPNKASIVPNKASIVP